MTNVLYDPFVAAYLTQAANQVDFDADDIRVILVDSGAYTFSAAHDFLDDIPAGARIAVGPLAGESVTNRTFDASDITFTAVTGVSIEYIVVYKHTGTESTSRLIARFDTATNLPVTPNGGDITVAWDNGTNKIFTL